MIDLFKDVFDFSVRLSDNIDFIIVGAITVLATSLIDGAYVVIGAATEKKPRFSKVLPSLYFLATVYLYVFAIINYRFGGRYFGGYAQAFVYFVVLNVAIAGLYAGFLFIAAVIYDKHYIRSYEVGATKDSPLAVLDEVQINEDVLAQKTEEGFVKADGATMVITDKLGSRKPRLDDEINYFRLQGIIDALLSSELSPIEKASVNMHLKTMRYYKNTVITADSRKKINDALSGIVKIYAAHKI